MFVQQAVVEVYIALECIGQEFQHVKGFSHSLSRIWLTVLVLPIVPIPVRHKKNEKERFVVDEHLPNTITQNQNYSVADPCGQWVRQLPTIKFSS